MTLYPKIYWMTHFRLAPERWQRLTEKICRQLSKCLSDNERREILGLDPK